MVSSCFNNEAIVLSQGKLTVLGVNHDRARKNYKHFIRIRMQMPICDRLLHKAHVNLTAVEATYLLTRPGWSFSRKLFCNL